MLFNSYEFIFYFLPNDFTFIDALDLPVPHDYFVDFTHVNVMGGKQLTTFIMQHPDFKSVLNE